MGDITDLLEEQTRGPDRVHAEDTTSTAVASTKAAPRAKSNIEPGVYTIDGYTFEHKSSRTRPIYEATIGGRKVYLKGAHGRNLNQLRTETSTLTKKLGRHDHICRPCDYLRNIKDSPFEGYEFMVLPHGGETVNDVVASGITTNDALTILVQVGGALTHAHSKDVVHRDIKPSNIVHDKKVAKIIDYGIGGHLGDVHHLDRFRGHGTIVYVSPEQENHEDPSLHSDVYSFCATALYILTGKPPFGTKPACIEDGILEYITDRRFRRFVPDQIKEEFGAFGSHLIQGLSDDQGERPLAHQLYISAAGLRRERAKQAQT
tara:strand:- start:2820 stop:3773 length:954 start_codon:yes stop_codon:yes gene_type:complete